MSDEDDSGHEEKRPALKALELALVWKVERVLAIINKKAADRKADRKGDRKTDDRKTITIIEECLTNWKQGIAEGRTEKCETSLEGLEQPLGRSWRTLAGESKISAVHIGALLQVLGHNGMTLVSREREVDEPDCPRLCALDEDGWSPMHWAVAALVLDGGDDRKGKEGMERLTNDEKFKYLLEEMDSAEHVKQAFGHVLQTPELRLEGYSVPVPNPLLRGTGGRAWTLEGRSQDKECYEGLEDDLVIRIRVSKVSKAGAETTAIIERWVGSEDKKSQEFNCKFDVTSNTLTMEAVSCAAMDGQNRFNLVHALPKAQAKYNPTDNKLYFGEIGVFELLPVEEREGDKNSAPLKCDDQWMPGITQDDSAGKGYTDYLRSLRPEGRWFKDDAVWSTAPKKIKKEDPFGTSKEAAYDCDYFESPLKKGDIRGIKKVDLYGCETEKTVDAITVTFTDDVQWRSPTAAVGSPHTFQASGGDGDPINKVVVVKGEGEGGKIQSIQFHTDKSRRGGPTLPWQSGSTKSRRLTNEFIAPPDCELIGIRGLNRGKSLEAVGVVWGAVSKKTSKKGEEKTQARFVGFSKNGKATIQRLERGKTVPPEDVKEHEVSLKQSKGDKYTKGVERVTGVTPLHWAALNKGDDLYNFICNLCKKKTGGKEIGWITGTKDQRGLAPFMYSLRAGNTWLLGGASLELDAKEKEVLLGQFHRPISSHKSIASYLWSNYYTYSFSKQQQQQQQTRHHLSHGGGFGGLSSSAILSGRKEIAAQKKEERDEGLGEQYKRIWNAFEAYMNKQIQNSRTPQVGDRTPQVGEGAKEEDNPDTGGLLWLAQEKETIEKAEKAAEMAGGGGLRESEGQRPSPNTSTKPLLRFILHSASASGCQQTLTSVLDVIDDDMASFMKSQWKKKRGIAETALSLAVRNGHKDIVELLLDNKADPEDAESAAVASAVEARQVELLGFLKDKLLERGQTAELRMAPSMRKRKGQFPDVAEVLTVLDYDLLQKPDEILTKSNRWWPNSSSKQSLASEHLEKKINRSRNRNVIIIVGGAAGGDSDDSPSPFRTYLESPFLNVVFVKDDVYKTHLKGLLLKMERESIRRGDRKKFDNVITYTQKEGEELDIEQAKVDGGATSLLDADTTGGRTLMQLLHDFGVRRVFFAPSPADTVAEARSNVEQCGRGVMAALHGGLEAALVLEWPKDPSSATGEDWWETNVDKPGTKKGDTWVLKDLLRNLKMSGGRVILGQTVTSILGDVKKLQEKEKSAGKDLPVESLFTMQDYVGIPRPQPTQEEIEEAQAKEAEKRETADKREERDKKAEERKLKAEEEKARAKEEAKEEKARAKAKAKEEKARPKAEAKAKARAKAAAKAAKAEAKAAAAKAAKAEAKAKAVAEAKAAKAEAKAARAEATAEERALKKKQKLEKKESKMAEKRAKKAAEKAEKAEKAERKAEKKAEKAAEEEEEEVEEDEDSAEDSSSEVDSDVVSESEEEGGEEEGGEEEGGEEKGVDSDEEDSDEEDSDEEDSDEDEEDFDEEDSDEEDSDEEDSDEDLPAPASLKIKISEIEEDEETDSWLPYGEPLKLTYPPGRILIKCREWEDQGWGAQKGAVSLKVIPGPDAPEFRGRSEVFGEQTGGVWGIFGSSGSREADEAEAVIGWGEKDSQWLQTLSPGDSLQVVYRVGGGGGHSLTVKGLYVEVMPEPLKMKIDEIKDDTATAEDEWRPVGEPLKLTCCPRRILIKCREWEASCSGMVSLKAIDDEGKGKIYPSKSGVWGETGPGEIEGVEEVEAAEAAEAVEAVEAMTAGGRRRRPAEARIHAYSSVMGVSDWFESLGPGYSLQVVYRNVGESPSLTIKDLYVEVVSGEANDDGDEWNYEDEDEDSESECWDSDDDSDSWDSEDDAEDDDSSDWDDDSDWAEEEGEEVEEQQEDEHDGDAGDEKGDVKDVKDDQNIAKGAWLRCEVQRKLLASPSIDYQSAITSKLLNQMSKGHKGKFDFGSHARSGELFLYLAQVISEQENKQDLKEGFKVAGVEIMKSEYRFMRYPLHYLILKAPTNGAAEKLLFQCVQHLNRKALAIPPESQVDVKMQDGGGFQKGTVVAIREATLATEAEVDVLLTASGRREVFLRKDVRFPRSIEQSGEWWKPQKDWEWKLARLRLKIHKHKSEKEEGGGRRTVHELLKTCSFGSTLRKTKSKRFEDLWNTLKHLLQYFGDGEGLSAVEFCASMCTLMGSTEGGGKISNEILSLMVGDGAGLVPLSTMRGRDFAGNNYQADEVCDLWGVSPMLSVGGNRETAVPVLHSILRCLRILQSDETPDRMRFLSCWEKLHGTLQPDKKEGDEDGEKQEPWISNKWYPHKARHWVQKKLYGASFVPTDRSVLMCGGLVDDQIKVLTLLQGRFQTLAHLLVASSGGIERVLFKQDEPTALVKLEEDAAWTHSWAATPGRHQKWMSSEVDRAGLFVSSYCPRSKEDGSQQPAGGVAAAEVEEDQIWSLGLSLLLQVADDSLLKHLARSKALKYKSCGLSNEALNEFLTCGGAVLLQHRHLWRATQGGHETKAYDRRLGMSHWAALHGNRELLDAVLGQGFGEDETFISESAKDDFVPCGSIYCQVSELGYSPLHFAMYSASAGCADSLITHLENDRSYSTTDLNSFINLRATHKISPETAPLVLHSRDLDRISELFHYDWPDEWRDEGSTFNGSDTSHESKFLDVILDECKRFSTDGDTALHVAVQFCHVRCVNLLLKKGADVTSRTTLEALDSHDIGLALQHHLSLQQLKDPKGSENRPGGRVAMDDRPEEAANAVDEMIDAFDEYEDSKLAVFYKLKANSYWRLLTGPSAVYLFWYAIMISVCLLYLKGGGFLGPNALVASLGEWGKGDPPPKGVQYELSFTDLANTEELGGWIGQVIDKFFENVPEVRTPGNDFVAANTFTAHHLVLGAYTLVGAMRIQMLRADQGDCGARQECWKAWSPGSNNATNHGVATYQNWEQSGLASTMYYSPATFNVFPTYEGLVVDLAAWGDKSALAGNVSAAKAIFGADCKKDCFKDDPALRFVAIYMPLYNANTGRVYQTEFYFEVPMFGFLWSEARVAPIRMRQYQQWEDYMRFGFEIVLICLMLFYVFEEFIDVVRAAAKGCTDIEEEREGPSQPWLKGFWDSQQEWYEEQRKNATDEERTRLENEQREKPVIKILQEGALRNVLVPLGKSIWPPPACPLLEILDKDAEVGEWREYEWSRDIDLLAESAELRNQVKRLWGEIAEVYALHGGDVSGVTPCHKREEWKGCCDLSLKCARSLKIWLYPEGHISENFIDVAILTLLFLAIGGRFLLFMQVQDMPNLYEMLDNRNPVMGMTFNNFVAAGAVEIRLRYILAFAIVVAGLKVVTILQGFPNLGPIFNAITTTVGGSADVAIFIFVWFIMILTFFIAIHVAFASTQGTGDFRGMGTSFFSTYRLSLGDWDYESFVEVGPVLGPIIFLVTSLILPLIMLNILIAVIGNVYDDLADSAYSVWRKQAMLEYVSHGNRLGFVDPDDAAFPLPNCLAFAGSKRMNFAKQIGKMRLATSNMAWAGLRYPAVTRTALDSRNDQAGRKDWQKKTGDLIDRMTELAQGHHLGKFKQTEE